MTTNLIYVSVDGSDNNSGLLEGDAASIGGAAAVAQDGTPYMYDLDIF